MARSLMLKRQTVVDLTCDELLAVVGGAATDTCIEKITDKFFHSYRCTQ